MLVERLANDNASLRQELQRRDVLGPALLALATAIDQVDTKRRGAARQLAGSTELGERCSLGQFVRTLDDVSVRLVAGLTAYGYRQMSIPVGSAIDPKRCRVRQVVRGGGSSTPGAVAKVVNRGWEEEQTGRVFRVAVVDVFGSGEQENKA